MLAFIFPIYFVLFKWLLKIVLVGISLQCAMIATVLGPKLEVVALAVPGCLIAAMWVRSLVGWCARFRRTHG